jgi:hypothetical protein
MTERITTTVVGSYPQPDWLVDKAQFTKNLVPRIRMREVWRVAPPWLEEAPDGSVHVGVRDMERAGIALVTNTAVAARGAATGTTRACRPSTASRTPCAGPDHRSTHS